MNWWRASTGAQSFYARDERRLEGRTGRERGPGGPGPAQGPNSVDVSIVLRPVSRPFLPRSPWRCYRAAAQLEQSRDGRNGNCTMNSCIDKRDRRSALLSRRFVGSAALTSDRSEVTRSEMRRAALHCHLRQDNPLRSQFDQQRCGHAVFCVHQIRRPPLHD